MKKLQAHFDAKTDDGTLETKDMVTIIKCVQEYTNSENKNPIRVIEEIRKLPEEKARILLAMLNKAQLTKEVSKEDTSSCFG